jgi:hypothetical protein
VPSTKSRGMKKFVSYGSAAAVAGAGFAGASVALSAPASAEVTGGCGVACYLYLSNDSNDNITYQGVRALTGQSGTVCNVALYNANQVEVGDAISQGPQISCVGFNQHETYAAGAKGITETYTLALWMNGNVIGTLTAAGPFGS